MRFLRRTSRRTQQSLNPCCRFFFFAPPVPAQAFLRAALALETQRAACGLCKAPFLYLLDATLEAEGLGPLIECLAEVALERLLRFALRLGRGAARDALLRDHALCFLAYCAHRFTRVRRFAFRSLVSLARRPRARLPLQQHLRHIMRAPISHRNRRPRRWSSRSISLG